MRRKWSNRAIYLATAAAMVALTGGFVLATTVTSISAPPPQGGGYTSAGTPPAGVATTATRLSQASATALATTNSLSGPASLTATTSPATDTIHVNAVGAVGDYVQTVTLTFTAGSPQVAQNQEYEVSIYIDGATSTPQVVYVETATGFASPAVDTVNFEYDVGSGSSSITITAVSDLITQCSAVGTC
jgi:hypothetical protein